MSESKTKKFEDIADPGLRAFLLEGQAFYPSNAIDFSLAEQRDFYDRYCAHFRKPRPESIETKDVSFASVSCRIYTKRWAEAAPALLYLHGGSFILGGLESHDDICAEICDGAGVDVVAAQYRLTPEHPFPAAFDDCWAVLTQLAERYTQLMVGGDSAGGNLAAALAIKARDEGRPPLRGQVLIYPGLGGDLTKGSYVTQAHAPAHTTSDVRYSRGLYKGSGSKFGAPLLETDFTGLPPAFLVAAGIDPLHGDSIDYAARLVAAGVPTQVRDEPLLVHAFLRARYLSEPARASFAAIVEAVASLAHTGQLPSRTP